MLTWVNRGDPGFTCFLRLARAQRCWRYAGPCDSSALEASVGRADDDPLAALRPLAIAHSRELCSPTHGMDADQWATIAAIAGAR